MVGMHELNQDPAVLKGSIRRWGMELGFDAIGFSGIGIPDAERNLAAWLAAGCHGEMDYMATHTTARGNKRALPDELVQGTRSIITARMNYRPAAADFCPGPALSLLPAACAVSIKPLTASAATPGRCSTSCTSWPAAAYLR